MDSGLDGFGVFAQFSTYFQICRSFGQCAPSGERRESESKLDILSPIDLKGQSKIFKK